MQGVSNHYT